jgi:hypothetical protein
MVRSRAAIESRECRAVGDPAIGDFGDAKVVRKFGHVSDDLSAL